MAHAIVEENEPTNKSDRLKFRFADVILALVLIGFLIIHTFIFTPTGTVGFRVIGVNLLLFVLQFIGAILVGLLFGHLLRNENMSSVLGSIYLLIGAILLVSLAFLISKPILLVSALSCIPGFVIGYLIYQPLAGKKNK